MADLALLFYLWWSATSSHFEDFAFIPLMEWSNLFLFLTNASAISWITLILSNFFLSQAGFFADVVQFQPNSI